MATTKALMRRCNVGVTLNTCGQSVQSAQREAQSRLVQAVPFPSVPTERVEMSVSS